MAIGKRNSGNSMVEMIMVMTLLILIGIAMFTLMSAGTNAQENIIENKSSQTDARIAASYLNVRLRQSCEQSKINILPCPLTGNNAILIENRGESDTDRWIYFDNGNLYEFLGLAGDEPRLDFSVPIMELEDFSVTYDMEHNRITTEISYLYGGEKMTISSIFYIRVLPALEV